MEITLRFHSSLIKYTNVKSYVINTESPTQIIIALKIMFPKLSMLFSRIDSGQINSVFYLVTKEKKILETKYFNRDILPENTEELWVIPTVYGSGRALNFILGAVLIAVGFALGPETSLIGVDGFLTGSSLISSGISYLLSGILSFLTPKQKAPSTDSSERKDNDIFGALQNTTTSDNAVALNYGLIRTAGQFVSGHIQTINHDKNTDIKVHDYI